MSTLTSAAITPPWFRRSISLRYQDDPGQPLQLSALPGRARTPAEDDGHQRDEADPNTGATLTGSVLCSPIKVHTSVPLENRTKFRGLGQV
jgi:hypothetical protein